ncbi:DUF2920 family protein, partial [Campylobacter upsaliensis]
DDVELGIKRESKLEFRLCWEDSKEIKSLIFIIPGLGADADENYREHLAGFVASEFEAAVVSVNYHCIGNRSLTGVDFYLDEIDKMIIDEFCKSIHFKTPPLDSINSKEALTALLELINAQILKLKQQKRLNDSFHPTLTATLKPARNEYNNFGIMSALDILNALFYIQKNPPFNTGGGGGKDVKNLPVILIGSSHGGYLAHLVSKIAPWAINGVIDNSGYAKFPWHFIGFGKEIDYMKHISVGTAYKEINLHCFDKTFWTSNRYSPHFFSPARRKIRYILEPEHLAIQANYPKPIYVSYHSIKDKDIAPPDEKQELYALYETLGFKAKLNLIKKESQIDGKFIKSLEHGLDMSIKSLINKELPPMLAQISTYKNPPCSNKSIAYPSDDLLYHFSQKSDKMHLKISKAKDTCSRL